VRRIDASGREWPKPFAALFSSPGANPLPCPGPGALNFRIGFRAGWGQPPRTAWPGLRCLGERGHPMSSDSRPKAFETMPCVDATVAGPIG